MSRTAPQMTQVPFLRDRVPLHRPALWSGTYATPAASLPVTGDGSSGATHRPAARDRAASHVQHPGRVLVIIGLAQLMVVLDTTIVNIALPSAQAALGFGVENRQWVVTAYSLAFGSLLLIGGRLSDLIGRRRTLLIGLLGFAAASAVGGAAVGFAMLIAARAAQGVFAAVLAPAALSTLNVTFTEPRARGRAFGVYAAIAAGGAVIGLLLGGALTEWLSWRWCLYVNLVFALPAALGVLAFLPRKEVAAERARQLDWLGVVTVSGGLFCLVYGLSNAETDRWTAPLTVAMFIASAVLLIAFVAVEARAKQPLLPLRIVADRNRAGAYFAIAVAFCAMFSVFLFLTYYVQQNLGYSPLKTGVAFLPFAAGIAVSAGLSNTKLVPRFGPRPLVPTGMLIAAGAMFWLSHLDVTSTYAKDVVGPLVLLGLGVGLTFAPSIATATAGVPRGDAGVASAMVNTSQQIGGAVGTAALSTIFASALTRYLTHHRPSAQLRAEAAIHGYSVAFSVACGLFLAGTVITVLVLRSGRLTTTDKRTNSPDSQKDQPVAPPPDNAKPDNARPDNARPDNARPDNARPDNARPDNARPDNARPDDARPASGPKASTRQETMVIAELKSRLAELEAENRYLGELLQVRGVEERWY
jgi:EmrB/QacA subfamily drug resistance transporter